jgi:hypothetical protein
VLTDWIPDIQVTRGSTMRRGCTKDYGIMHARLTDNFWVSEIVMAKGLAGSVGAKNGNKSSFLA